MWLECALPTAESSTAARRVGKGGPQLASVEVGPELVREDELGVRELPEQEVRDALLSARSDEQIGIGQLRRVQVRRKDVLVDLGRIDAALDDPPRRLHELCPAAIVERDPQVDARVQRGAVLHRRHALLELRGSAVATTD